MSQVDLEELIKTGPKLAEIPGMSAGKMFKLTEVFSKWMGSSMAASGTSPLLYNDMFYSLCQSSIGGSSWYNFSTARTSYNFPTNRGLPDAFSPIKELRHQNSKDTISELKRVLSFSQLSIAGSDDYREDLIKNKNYLQDFQVEEKEKELSSE